MLGIGTVIVTRDETDKWTARIVGTPGAIGSGDTQNAAMEDLLSAYTELMAFRADEKSLVDCAMAIYARTVDVVSDHDDMQAMAAASFGAAKIFMDIAINASKSQSDPG